MVFQGESAEKRQRREIKVKWLLKADVKYWDAQSGNRMKSDNIGEEERKLVKPIYYPCLLSGRCEHRNCGVQATSEDAASRRTFLVHIWASILTQEYRRLI
jgi:hypothetical protein